MKKYRKAYVMVPICLLLLVTIPIEVCAKDFTTGSYFLANWVQHAASTGITLSEMKAKEDVKETGTGNTTVIGNINENDGDTETTLETGDTSEAGKESETENVLESGDTSDDEKETENTLESNNNSEDGKESDMETGDGDTSTSGDGLVSEDDSNSELENNLEPENNSHTEENKIEDSETIEDLGTIDELETIEESPVPEGAEPEDNKGEEQIITANQLSEDSAIVTTFEELKTALENDNGITTVYLGSDIAMKAKGIKIHVNKTSLLIDGIDPTDPDQTMHVFEDYSTTTQSESLYIPEKSLLKDVTMQNMKVIGRNYYGFISVSDSLYQVGITYKNIDYVGPQITYNRHGTAIYLDCNITIVDGNGGSPAHEVAEATYIEMGGNVNIMHKAKSDRVFWMEYNQGAITIYPDSNIDIYIENTTLTYNPNIYTPITIGKNSVFRYNAPKKFGEHLLGDFTVEEGADCRIVTRDSHDATLLRLAGDLTVKEGATFQVIAKTSAPYLIVLFNRKSAYFNNPKNVLLYNNNKNTIGWLDAGGVMNISAQQLNYWQSAGASTIDNPPMYSWRKKEDEALVVNGTVPSGSNFPKITSNLNESDSNLVKLDESTFNLSTSRVVSFGTLRLTATLVHGMNMNISGMTEPDAEVQLKYIKDGVTQTNYTVADPFGNYIFYIDSNIEPGTEFTITSTKDYLTSSMKIYMEGELGFVSVPPTLEFKTSALSNMRERVERMISDWKLVISDTRQQITEWKLTARLNQELSTNTVPVHYIPNGIIFVDSNSVSYPLQIDEDTMIYKHNGTSKSNAIEIQWDTDKGILADIRPGMAYSNVEYHAGIQWNLVDAP